MSRMRLSIIAAFGNNREIGQEGKLPWSLPEDLRSFRKLTTGHTVIMGRNTYDSIGHPLNNRLNIIITSRELTSNGVVVVRDLNQAIESAPITETEAFIIGGQQVYQEALTVANRMYLTFVDGVFPHADAFFPEFNREDWGFKSSDVYWMKDNPEQTHDYIVRVFERK